MKTVVIDASVVLGWFFRDESTPSPAVLLLQDYLLENVRLIAPRLLEYEVLNGLLQGTRRGRLKIETARCAWTGFRELGLEFVDESVDGEAVLEASFLSDLSAYDGAYLALAVKEKAELATADKALAAAARKQSVALTWRR